MSIACGIHVGRVVVLAADTRTMMSVDGVLVPYADSEVKVHFWGKGFVAGVGESRTLHDAASRLASREIGSIDDMDTALADGWDDSVARAAKANPGLADLVLATALYATIGADGGPLVGVFAPGQVGPGLRRVPEGEVFGIPPADLPRGVWNGIRGGPVDQTEGDGERQPVQAVRTLAGVIARVAAASSQISSIADICVHRLAADGPHMWRVRGDARRMAEAATLAQLSEFEIRVERV